MSVAHLEQLHFVETVTRHLISDWTGKKVLEIGSYDVNGSIRRSFPGSDYTGVDLVEGPGVDVICHGDKVDFPNGSFDATASCECFEHNPNWVQTFLNMYRMTRPGGAVLITCASIGRLEHGTERTLVSDSPGTQAIGWNYYHNLSERDFRKRFDIDRLFSKYLFAYNPHSRDLYFVGLKEGGDIGLNLPKEFLSTEAILQLKPRSTGVTSVLSEALMKLLPDKLYQELRLFWLIKVKKIRSANAQQTESRA